MLPHPLLALAVLLLFGAPAPAAEEGAPRELPEVAAVQEALGLYLALPDRREAGERVVVQGDRLEAWFLRPLPRDGRDAALCDGFRWLLGGRLEASPGVQALFEAMPGIETVTLVFYDLETRVEAAARGGYQQLRNAAPVARYTMSRSRAKLIRPADARAALAGSSCVTNGRSLVDAFWVAPARGGGQP